MPVRAWQLNDSAAALYLSDIPEPKPGLGEILIRIQSAGITPTELQWYPTTHTRSGEKRTRAVPGHEFAGVVQAAGSDTDRALVGQEIYGMNDWFENGATAAFCVTKPEWIAPKPARLNAPQAASVPIGALTAWQGLLERANLKRGETILIHGGSGAVGVFAIQIARRQGARVITTASARNREFLLKLGAEQVIDYHTERFEDRAKEMDVVFDTVGGETLKRSWAVLGTHGRLVTVAAESERLADERDKKAFFIVELNRSQLIEIGELLDAGEMTPVVDAVVPFSQAGAAYAGNVSQRAGRGKVVVIIEEQQS
jgi:NADPH:quinone reductase-like Zn-dependent oxidoreductase